MRLPFRALLTATLTAATLAVGGLTPAPAQAAPSQEVPCDVKTTPYKRTFSKNTGTLQDLAHYSQVDITCKPIDGRMRAAGLTATGWTEAAPTLWSTWKRWGPEPVTATDRYPDANGYHVRLILHSSCINDDIIYFRPVVNIDAVPAPGSGHTPFRKRNHIPRSATAVDCDPSPAPPTPVQDLGKGMPDGCTRNITAWKLAANKRSASADVTANCNLNRSVMVTDMTFTAWRSTFKGAISSTRPFEKIALTTRALSQLNQDMAVRVTIPVEDNSWNGHRLDVQFGMTQQPHPPLRHLRYISKGNGPISLLRGRIVNPL